MVQDDATEIVSKFSGKLSELLQLRTVVAVYLVERYPISRPKALLGDQNFRSLLRQIKTVTDLFPPGTFSTMKVTAAGADSTVFRRIKSELSSHTGLLLDEDADLLVRVKPWLASSYEWGVSLRISPRPLSTRPWRVRNMPGALNATLAAAMVEMTEPDRSDEFINLMCGSGTLLVERLERSDVKLAVGCDLDPVAIEAAKENLRASKFHNRVGLIQADATHLEYEDDSFNVICCDLPYGQLVGSHEANKELYRATLAEVTRIAKPGARLVLLTHEIRLLDNIIGDYSDSWVLKDVVKVFQGGLHPRIYSLHRLDDRST